MSRKAAAGEPAGTGKYCCTADLWLSKYNFRISGFSAYDVSHITTDELRLIEAFFQRRDSLDPALRGSMAAQISNRIAGKLRVQVYGWPRNEKFLEAVHAQYRAGGRLRAD
jgi:hypothetical protein